MPLSFLVCDFARFREPAASVPPLRRHPFFCATFCNNSTSSPPDLSRCLPDLGTPSFLGPLKSLNLQQSFFCAHFREFLRNPAAGPASPALPGTLRQRETLLGCQICQIPGSRQKPFFVLLPVILYACCPGSDLPRLRPGCIGGNVGFCWGVACCQPVIYPRTAGFSRFPPAADLSYLVVSLWE